MRKSDAIPMTQKAFGDAFQEQSFQEFIANLLKNYIRLDKTREGDSIREAFRPFILKYKLIGYFEDNEKNKIDVLWVLLKRETSLERARTAQRNFVADYLKNNAQGKRDAALVAFIAPEEQDWRFSLVKLEYSLEVKEGKVKTNEDLTPAKRWSFLVGKNEGSHTAQSRFVSLLESDDAPNLRELEEAFNIEKVTNEFFEKYCELFQRMKESLDGLLEKDPQLKIDFESKEISTVDFAKKTLGQMAFLYFLQKKGWFGVFPDKEWGSGAKNFLRELFNRREKYGKNFFDDVLEPLFYEALAQDRGRDAIYPRLNNCRMPFLNGGLFEPMNGYAWETTHISLPDELFSNKNRTKEGDTGDGILDIFDRYNFTVNENEPLEKEVAVDPEMLGKVFENLLEIRDRKSKGAFYTPREIVHYMCQESLINYLHSETGESIPREDIETFIQKGIQIIQNDKTVLEKGRETDTYKFMLPASIRSEAAKLDALLANIKVCDPAVGSGAFPLGMLNEIVRARQVLGVHSGSTLSPYDLKLHTISHSIYGVDIDSGAVEIAKLRMWLALVVEEKDPHPLPNLEYKIMQGNSLLSEYEGIKLFDDSFLADINAIEKEKAEINTRLFELQRQYFDLHSKNELDPVSKTQIESEIKQLQKRLNGFAQKNELTGENIGLFDTPTKQRVAQEKTEKLQKKIEQFVSECRRTQKQNLKDEINTLKWELIEATLDEQGRMDKLEEIRTFRRKNIRPFFIWKLEFSDVFKEKGGFDVVIGNPPYVNLANIQDESLRRKLQEIYTTVKNKSDLYSIFTEKGTELLKEKGILSFIFSNSWLSTSSFSKFREFLIENTKIHTLVRCPPKVFENATVTTVVIIFSKEKVTSHTIDLEYSENHKFYKFKDGLSYQRIKNTAGYNFSFEKEVLFKCKCKKLGSIAKFSLGIKTSNDEKFILHKKIDSDCFPVLRGKDMAPYFIPTSIKQFIWYKPSLMMEKRGAGPRNKDIFLQKEKLLFQDVAQRISVVYDDKQLFSTDTLSLIYEINSQYHIKFLMGVLNSTFINVLYKSIYPTGLHIKLNELKELPIPDINQQRQESIIKLVDQILAITLAPDYNPKKPPVRQKELEAKIDEMVFDLYELTPEEREVVLKS